MRGQDPPPFICERVRQLWKSEIQDLSTLLQNYSTSVLVALDTEASSQVTGGSRKPSQDVSEVGIAILPLDGRITQPYEGIKQLHHEGDSREEITAEGETDWPRNESKPEDITLIIESILSKYKGQRILVGFDLYNDLKWISKDCPAIASYFTARIDVQDFARQRCEEFATEPAKAMHPCLTNILKTMNIRDERRHQPTHHAVNDALRTLIVLCGLASDPTLLSDMCSRPATRNSVQCYPQLKFKHRGIHHPFIARVSAANGGKLPPLSPQAVSRRFAAHSGIKAVGLNWRSEKDKAAGVRFWHFSFCNVESLDKSIVQNNGSIVSGIRLLIARAADKSWG